MTTDRPDRTDQQAPVKVTGAIGSGDYFRFVERYEIDWAVWSDVLRGKVAGAIFRGALSPDDCDRIRGNFWNSPIRKPLGSKAAPNDQGCGARLVYSSGIEAYLDEAERVRPHIDALFAGTDRGVPSLLDDFRAYLAKRGVELRLAEHRGRQAGQLKMRSCKSTGRPALLPHDDTDTLRRAPHLRGFEAQRAEPVCGVIACVENGSGGALSYWNISPDQETRRAMNFGFDSYGFPEESLDAFQKLTVPVSAGDVYLFNVGNVHSVGPVEDDRTPRSTIQWNLGFLDSRTVLQWC